MQPPEIVAFAARWLLDVAKGVGRNEPPHAVPSRADGSSVVGGLAHSAGADRERAGGEIVALSKLLEAARESGGTDATPLLERGYPLALAQLAIRVACPPAAEATAGTRDFAEALLAGRKAGVVELSANKYVAHNWDASEEFRHLQQADPRDLRVVGQGIGRTVLRYDGVPATLWWSAAATLHLDDLSLERTASMQADVLYASAGRVVATHVELRGAYWRNSQDKIGGYGACANGTGEIDLRNCIIAECNRGAIRASDRARVRAVDCVVVRPESRFRWMGTFSTANGAELEETGTVEL